MAAKLVKEARKAVDAASGLHATRRKHATRRMEWVDVGAATVARVAELIQLHQPLMWHLTKLLQPFMREYQ